MKHIPLVAVFGIAMITVPLMLVRAGVDANEDGCVDLEDYAIMQRSFTGPECGMREVRSFYVFGGDGEIEIIPEVPGENGFIVTDLYCRVDAPGNVVVRLEERFGEETEVKFRFVVFGYDSPADFHFNSGIVLASGAKAVIVGNTLQDVTISGYTY